MRKPEWLKSNKLGAKKTSVITGYLRSYKLNSVCESAQCPNKGECFERGTATFMILGDVCTRNCTFCAIKKSEFDLLPPNPDEPKSIAELTDKLNLKYVVITTVTRDDLPDGGAEQMAKTVTELKALGKEDVAVEVLISDLQGNLSALKTILDSNPDVLNHNIETINRLYSEVRPKANYNTSLKILKTAKEINPDILTKSGFMVGLGETFNEVTTLMNDLRNSGVDILTIGQYMQPSVKHYNVREYVHPDVFKKYETIAKEIGFILVESGPLVRSSYHAEKAKDFLKHRS
ncbi:MAG: lipoyl synthase [Candidatus Cloacimonetes bacterium]|nr:lipoyl synthase [Candidatus Cloacimonadota bacterium]